MMKVQAEYETYIFAGRQFEVEAIRPDFISSFLLNLFLVIEGSKNLALDSWSKRMHRSRRKTASKSEILFTSEVPIHFHLRSCL